MKIVRLKGGLGNQMFQYAFGRRITAETGVEVKLDALNGFKDDFFERYFCLHNYAITLDTADREELEKYHFYNAAIPGRFLEKVRSDEQKYIVKESHRFTYMKKLFNNSEDRYYDGYWQNPEYFQNIKPILLREFNLKDETKQSIENLENEILNCQSVGIHVRKPHALKNNIIDSGTLNRFEVITKEYYLKAISILNRVIKGMSFYVFTDDTGYAKEILSGIDLKSIQSNKEYEDLYLLSRCRHQIISNSTFSWWSAWLNINKDKIVISPQFWYKDHSIKLDSLLNGFIKI